MSIRLTVALVAFSSLAACTAPEISNSNEPAERVDGTDIGDSAITQVFEIGPEMIPCEGVGPRHCLVVNNSPFYDGIDGFEHVPGTTTVAEVKRTQWCDPDVLNSCPQDAGIYTYQLIRVISQH